MCKALFWGKGLLLPYFRACEPGPYQNHVAQIYHAFVTQANTCVKNSQAFGGLSDNPSWPGLIHFFRQHFLLLKFTKEVGK